MLAVGTDLVPLPQRARGHALERVHWRGHRDVWRVPGQQVHVIVFPVALGQDGAEVAAHFAGYPVQVADMLADQHPSARGDKDQISVQGGNHVPAAAVAVADCLRPGVISSAVLVRYRYRLRPTRGQQMKLKARRRVAVVHRKVRETRLDHAHKTALRLVRDSQAVYAEDLAVSGLARTRLAKSVHDAGWAQLLRLIGEKAGQYGRTFHQVGRFTPTSQTCSACGAKDGPKPLHVRSWECSACRAVHDRDINAARNVLAAGRAERLNACGGTVRPGASLARPSETGTHRGAT
jgi:hypothetical protein